MPSGIGMWSFCIGLSPNFKFTNAIVTHNSVRDVQSSIKRLPPLYFNVLFTNVVPPQPRVYEYSQSSVCSVWIVEFWEFRMAAPQFGRAYWYSSDSTKRMI